MLFYVLNEATIQNVNTEREPGYNHTKPSLFTACRSGIMSSLYHQLYDLSSLNVNTKTILNIQTP